jgi:hypothetical protein
MRNAAIAACQQDTAVTHHCDTRADGLLAGDLFGDDTADEVVERRGIVQPGQILPGRLIGDQPGEHDDDRATRFFRNHWHRDHCSTPSACSAANCSAE